MSTNLIDLSDYDNLYLNLYRSSKCVWGTLWDCSIDSPSSKKILEYLKAARTLYKKPFLERFIDVFRLGNLRKQYSKDGKVRIRLLLWDLGLVVLFILFLFQSYVRVAYIPPSIPIMDLLNSRIFLAPFLIYIVIRYITVPKWSDYHDNLIQLIVENVPPSQREIFFDYDPDLGFRLKKYDPNWEFDAIFPFLCPNFSYFSRSNVFAVSAIAILINWVVSVVFAILLTGTVLPADISEFTFFLALYMILDSLDGMQSSFCVSRGVRTRFVNIQHYLRDEHENQQIYFHEKPFPGIIYKLSTARNNIWNILSYLTIFTVLSGLAKFAAEAIRSLFG